MAATDDALRARRDALATLADKVPVLGKVADQIAKVLDASPRTATSELLALAAMTWQLRAAQAQFARVHGDARDVPRCEPIDTPLLAHQIEPLYDALMRSGSGRRELIEDALARGVARDLRLVRAWVAAIGDGDAEIARLAAERGVPALGQAAAPLLADGLRTEDGGRADARRLLCLAHASPPIARPRIDRALEHGNAAMRSAAIEALGVVDAAAAEPIAIAMLARERAGDVRAAAATALASASSDAALDALITALDTESAREVVAASLRSMKHPHVAQRLLARLTPELLARASRAHGPAPRGAAAAKRKGAATGESDDAQKASAYAVCLIEGLGARDDAGVEATLTELWNSHADAAIVHAAGRRLAAIATPSARAVLTAGLVPGAIAGDRLNIALRAVLDGEPVQAFDTLVPFFDDKALARKGGFAVVEAILAQMQDAPNGVALDPRWGPVLMHLTGFAALAQRVLYALARCPTLARLERIVELIVEPRIGGAAIELLVNMRDKRAVPHLIAALDRKDFVYVYNVCDALAALDDPSAIQPLRAYHAKITAPSKKPASQTAGTWIIGRVERTLQYLERDRTVS
jgi:hypothetical protein